MATLPTGTVTFLFTDLETSTRLWEEQPEALMRDALARHDAILRDAVDRHHGVMLASMGDGVAAVFASAPDAVAAALEAQRELVSYEGVGSGLLRSRMGLHTDEGRLRAPGEYVNRPLNRCARLMAVAHGGQVLLSDATVSVVRRILPEGAELVDLGEHHLRDIMEPVHVFQLTHPSLPADFPPVRSLSSTAGNLPRPVTSFVGRDAEVAQVVALVRERPIVTLTGVGGVGKTRLALEVALELLDAFPAGAWLCELAPVVDADAVWDAVAGCLGVQPNPTRPLDETVIEHLAPQRLLLVLDNCEHLLEAVAIIADRVRSRCPHVAVLATSREGLALAGEQLVAIPALPVPTPNPDVAEIARNDAVRLFCDRAADMQPDFELSRENVDAVAQLCRRLDGIPLAIELAAARISSLPPEELLARIDQRFRLLTRGSRSALERHQTLRNTIDWSYNLLGADEQRAFQRLSVFAGTFSLAAAEAIVTEGDALDLVSSLVDKSLVLVDPSSPTARYRMLEMIRQYAQERLEDSGDAMDVRRRHAEYFVAVTEAAGPHLRDRDQLQWVAKLKDDAENIRVALDWAIESESADVAMRLIAPVMVTGIPIGWKATNWAELALDVSGAETHQLYPLIAGFAALGTALHNDKERSHELVASALAAQARLGTEHLWVLTAAGVVALLDSDLDAAVRYSTQWEAAARRHGDLYELANALILLAAARLIDSPSEAVRIADEAIEVARDSGVPSALLYALVVRTNFAGEEGFLEELAEEGMTVATMVGDTAAAGAFVAFQGWMAGRRGDWTTTLETAIDGLDGFLDALEVPWPGIFGGAASAFANLGDYETAAVLHGYTDAHAYFPAVSGTSFGVEFAALPAQLIEHLGQDQFSELSARGAALDDRKATDLLRSRAAQLLDR